MLTNQTHVETTKDEFKVTVEKEKHHLVPPGRNIALSVTNNGWQWTTIHFTEEQLKEVQKEINKFLKKG